MQISTPLIGKPLLELNYELTVWVCFLKEEKQSYRTPFQVTDLGSFGCSSIDTGGLEARSSAIFCSYLLYLLCQLTGRGEHQALSMKYTDHFLHVSQQATSVISLIRWGQESVNAQNLQKQHSMTYNGSIATFQERLMVDVHDCWQQVLRNIQKIMLIMFSYICRSGLKDQCTILSTWHHFSEIRIFNLQRAFCQTQSGQCQPYPGH